MKRKRDNDETSVWISNTDLMSGLLVLFLFIAICMTQSSIQANEKVKELTGSTTQVRQEMQKSLKANFTSDELKRYHMDNPKRIGDASFDKGDGRFLAGSAELTTEFRQTLAVFLPKYIKAIDEVYEKNPDKIVEIRIEGHTSSEWYGNADNSQGAPMSSDEAYIKNMELSQSRTRAIVNFALSMPELQAYHELIKDKLTANGLSSSRTIKKEDGSEDAEASRRIQFRVVTNDEAVLNQIEAEIQ